ncbi:MAG TPA: hypothetical protein VJ756_17190 [Terriglobales bacterium]|nr:hypothetical protein [Terriglobales bacterium]
MPNTKALLLLATILLLASCSRHKPITPDELQSQLTSAASLAAEAEIFVDYIRQNRATRNYAEGHREYLADQVKRASRELREAIPGQVSEEKLQEYGSELDSFANELQGVGRALDDPEALAVAKQRFAALRQTFKRTKSSQ